MNLIYDDFVENYIVCVLVTQSCLFAIPRTVACQTPLSMRFSGQEYWNGLPFPSPGDLPDPGIEPGSPALQADSLPSKPPGKSPKLYWLTRKLCFLVVMKGNRKFTLPTPAHPTSPHKV